MWRFSHESNQQGGFDFMCVPPELRCDFKNHASALCATPEACSMQITLLVLNQLTNRCAHRRFRR
jgi:hypothetical protein